MEHSLLRKIRAEFVVAKSAIYPNARSFSVICRIFVPKNVIGLQDLVILYVTVPFVPGTLVLLYCHIFIGCTARSIVHQTFRFLSSGHM